MGLSRKSYALPSVWEDFLGEVRPELSWRQTLIPSGYEAWSRQSPQQRNLALFFMGPESAVSLRMEGRGSWRVCGRKGWGHERSGSRKSRPESRVVEMSASGAVERGPAGVAAAPSPAPARAPAPGRLFRPISAEDEEQQPTEIESLCMNCYRNVSRSDGRREGWVEAASGGE